MNNTIMKLNLSIKSNIEINSTKDNNKLLNILNKYLEK